MGSVVVWKPAVTQQLAAHLAMELLVEAGLPPRVVNMVPGHGPEVSAVTLSHPMLAGASYLRGVVMDMDQTTVSTGVALPRVGGHRQREHQRREREQDVQAAHQHRVDRAPPEAGLHPSEPPASSSS